MTDTLPSETGKKEHSKRVITAATALVLSLGVYYFLRQLGVLVLTALVVVVATWELLNMLLSTKQPPLWRRWKALATSVVALAMFGLLYLQPAWTLIPLYIILFSIFGQALLFSHRDGALSTHLQDGLVQFFALFYIAGLLSYVPVIHGLPQGPTWFVLLLLSVWGGDIGAYYGGKTFGRHKLSLHLSPGKTWEGAGCGLLFVMAVGALFTYHYLPELALWRGALIAGLTSVAAQLGDLLESLIKRVSGVKDSGAIFPGHGGAFDRFDSLILAAPLFFLLLQLFS